MDSYLSVGSVGQHKDEEEESTVKSEAGPEEQGAAAGGAGHEDGNTPHSDSEDEGEAESSDDGGSAVSNGEGGNEGFLFKVCHETLANLDLFGVVLEYVGKGHFLFVAGTSKEWRTRYTHLYPALKTNLSSVVSSVECVKWAILQDLGLTVKVFGAAARHGDVEVCKALHGVRCPWDEKVSLAALNNERHGLSILQWLRSKHVPKKQRGVNVLDEWLPSEHLAGTARCPWSALICGYAARGGNIEILQWLLSEETNDPFDSFSWHIVCGGGQIPAVEYLLNHPRTRALLEEKSDDEWRCGAHCAAMTGHLGVLQFLHANAYDLCDWDGSVCRYAVLHAKSLPMLKWLRSEEVQCEWNEDSCPQVLRDRGILSQFDTESLEEVKQWVHANGHPCYCQD